MHHKMFIVAALCLAAFAGEAQADCALFATPGSGAILSGDAFCAEADGTAGDQLRAAQGGSGQISILDGAEITLEREAANPAEEQAGPGFIVGRSGPGVGTAVIDGSDSRLILEADGASAFAQVGRETTGSLSITDGGELIIRDRTAPTVGGGSSVDALSIGLDGGDGTLLVDQGSVLIDSAGGARLFVGRGGGVGSATLRNGSSLTLIDRETGDPDAAAGANMTLGRNVGGGGELMLESGSTLSVTATGDGVARVEIGRETGSSGAAIVTGGSGLTMTAAGRAELIVGRDEGAIGRLTISDGASVLVDGDEGVATIGREADASGAVAVTGGGSLQVTGATDGDILIGAAFADFGRENGGVGSVTVTGDGSTIEALDRIVVGAPDAFGGGVGIGSLIVGDGGVARARTVELGAGGRIAGDGGIIDADLNLDGGVLAPGASPGMLEVTGDLSILGGMMAFEIAGRADGAFDVLKIGGDVAAADPFTLQVSMIDGFEIAIGDRFDLVEIAGDVSALSGLIAGSGVLIDVIGPAPALTVELSDGALVVSVEAATAVPLPPTAPLLAAAMAILILWPMRRARLSPIGLRRTGRPTRPSSPGRVDARRSFC